MMMSKESVEITSKINELYSKTIITQKFINESENPVELKIYIYNDNRLLFSSFSAKIGDSITVKSKVIKKEKAEEKYTDSISSGNSAVFVTKDPNSFDRMIVNMGNIPPKQEVIFISEFLQFIESSKTHEFEFELFRNLPILQIKDSIIQPFDIKGIVEIKTKDAIKIDKIILSENLNIIQEEYLDGNKNNYLIKYEYKNLPELILNKHLDYIPSNKIYFERENNSPIIFYQKSSDEINYMIKYKYIQKKLNNNLNLNPALYIFLIDQSGSMKGEPMEVAIQALILFLQSLPPGSYYQIFGFGSYYKKYDESPKEYTQKNIEESIEFVKTLRGNFGGTNIYSPLNYIYKSYELYEKLKLPINIFLLTDEEIENKDDTLKLIEKYNDNFSIYSIGIGEYLFIGIIYSMSNLSKFFLLFFLYKLYK